MAPHVDLNTRPAQNPAPTEARPATWVPVAEKGLFAPKKMRVITVGAGHAGLMIAYKMRHEVKCESYVDHVIYEKNVRIAQTHFLNVSAIGQEIRRLIDLFL